MPNPILAKEIAQDAKGRLLVTVRKKAEPETSVPQTLRVFREDDVSRLRLQSPTDLSAQVSGFSFNDPFGRFNPAPSMRGMIQPGLGDEPSVAFFNDGIYLSGRSSINSLAFDLSRIEVAKGPQSALYGRNAFGGAINAISAPPTQKRETSLDVMLGNKNRSQLTAVYNAPINDTAALRLAYYTRDWGGYFKNSLAGGPDIGREKTQGGRLSLRLTPNPDRDIIVRLTHLADHDSQPKGFLVAANCGPRTSDSVLRYYCGELPDGDAPYTANDVNGTGYQRLYTRLSMDWNERINHNFSTVLTLGGSTENSEFARDDDYSAVQAARAGINARRFDVQADGRILYTPDSKGFSALGGFSLYHFNNFTHRQDQYYILGQTQPGGAIAKAITDTAALYGNVTVPLVSDMTLAFDGRLQREWKTLDSSIRDLSGAFLDLNGSWTAFTPKVTLSWQDTPGSPLVYASVGKGYKSGGFNDRANIYDSERLYGPEENWTYELGIKNTRLTPSLSLDAALFYVDWRKQQVLAYSQAGTTNNFFLTNSAKSHVQGLETGLHWQLGSTTRVGLYYTYADARFDDYKDPDLATLQDFNATGGDVSGKRLPRYSPHHIGVDLEDRRTLDEQWTWVNAAQFSFQSSQYTDNANYAKTGNRALLNMQTGAEYGDVYTGIYIDNVLDERNPPVGISWSDATTGFSRAWLVVPQDGRTFGVRAKIKF